MNCFQKQNFKSTQYCWLFIRAFFLLSLHVWDTWLASLFLLVKIFPQCGHGNSPGKWMSSMCLFRLVTMVLEQTGHTPPPTVGSWHIETDPGTRIRITIYFHLIGNARKILEGIIYNPLSMACASVISHFVCRWKHFSTFCTWCWVGNVFIFNVVWQLLYTLETERTFSRSVTIYT